MAEAIARAAHGRLNVYPDPLGTLVRREVSEQFNVEPDWKDHWRGMPDFKQADLKPKQSLLVHFKNDEDRHAFSKLLGQTITDATKFVWYPKAEIGRYADKRFKTEETVL